MKALVIGYGSIGKRHAENLSNLNHIVSIVEPDDKVRNNNYLHVFPSYKEIPYTNFDVAVICNPTEYHIRSATLTLEKIEGLKGIFIEKPLSYSLEGIDFLINECKERNIKLMCACNYRFESGINAVRRILSQNLIGKVLYVNYTFGHNLKLWKPNSDYTKSYSADKYGGVLLDAGIHAIDTCEYLFGNITKVEGMLYNTHTLNITNEDIANLIVEFDTGVIGEIHVDYLKPNYTHNMTITGTKGTIIWNFAKGEVCYNNNGSTWNIIPINESINNRNAMYVREMEYFINCIKNNEEPMTNGLSSLKVALKAKGEL